MKKNLIFFAIAFILSVNVSSQICALGNDIIEKNDFTYAKGILNRYKYTFYSDNELSAMGNNPNTKIIGTKGTDQTNSIMVIVEATNLKNSGIKLVTFICGKGYAIYLENDLSGTGYKKTKESDYLENGKINVNEKTYQRKTEFTIDTAIIKFFSGGAQITFQRDRIKK